MTRPLSPRDVNNERPCHGKRAGHFESHRETLSGATPESDFAQSLVKLRPRLLGRAMQLCNREDRAQDLVQDTFERALSHRSSFESGALLAWLQRIMRNLFIDGCRAARRYVEPDWDALPAPVQEVEPINDVLEILNIDDLKQQLSMLRRGDREIFQLAYFDGWSRRAIAERFGLEMSTTCTRLFRVKAKMRAGLERVIAGRAKFNEDARSSPSGRACPGPLRQAPDGRRSVLLATDQRPAVFAPEYAVARIVDPIVSAGRHCDQRCGDRSWPSQERHQHESSLQ